MTDSKTKICFCCFWTVLAVNYGKVQALALLLLFIHLRKTNNLVGNPLPKWWLYVIQLYIFLEYLFSNSQFITIKIFHCSSATNMSEIDTDHLFMFSFFACFHSYFFLPSLSVLFLLYVSSKTALGWLTRKCRGNVKFTKRMLLFSHSVTSDSLRLHGL